ncbi:protein kinase [Stieleria sp.]|uniref:protein kinase domain-containing protein n=1 Tax=Stieleria sp. TaxID=2795976 RepID=UPI003568985E
MKKNQPAGEADVNVFELIESVCVDFRRRWKSGDRPPIDPFLQRVSDEARPTLFRSLLQIDIGYRRRSGETPTSNDYLKKFAEFRYVVRQAFDEYSLMSMEAGGVRSSDSPSPDSHGDATVSMQVPSANRIGDYALVRELGRGGFGIVYEARHLRRNEPVALKTLPRLKDGKARSSSEAERLHRFRREFRSLCEINHAHLAGMQTLEVDGDRWFFTMDLVDGINFLDHVRPNDVLDEPRLRSSTKQLARGIFALHDRGIAHRDLKPSNVMVSEEGHLTILDFGLVGELQLASGDTVSIGTKHFAGTPRYAAPEQAVGRHTPATDWYAFGVMLYESLTGEPPLKGSGVDLLLRKQTEDAPKLAGRRDVPADLAALVDALLQRDPDRRPTAEQLSKSLGVEAESTIQASTDEDSTGLNRPPVESLIGRESQLSQLEAAFSAGQRQHQPIMALVQGKSGEGKTALIKTFLQRLRRNQDVHLFSGRCYDRESVPFKAIDSLIDPLVAFLKSRPAEHIAEWLQPDIVMLARLFPVLMRVDSIAQLPLGNATQLDAQQVRNRAFNALKILLQKVGGVSPTVFFIDDLQWGDSDSASVLMDLLSPPDPACILLIGSVRDAEASDSHFLRTWKALSDGRTDAPQLHTVFVGPLSVEECELLVANRLQHDSEEIRRGARQLHTITGGNAYLVDQLIESLGAGNDAVTSISLTDVIRRRLDVLPASAADLLEVISTSNQAILLEEAADAAGVPTSAFSTLTHMRSERLVRIVENHEGQLVDTYHDKIRESVVSHLSSERRRDLHRRIGEAIEKSEGIESADLVATIRDAKLDDQIAAHCPRRVFDLAYHFAAAQSIPQASVYSLLAAENAKSQHALEIAVDKYETANSMAQDFPPIYRYRIAKGLGDTQLTAGRYDLANQNLEAAVGLAVAEVQVIRAKAKQAEIVYKTGSLIDSIAARCAIIENLGVKVPKTKLGFVVATLRSKLARTVAGRVTKYAKKNGTATWETNLLTQTLVHLIYPCVFRDPLRALWASQTAIGLLDRVSDPHLRAHAHLVHGMTTGWHLFNERDSRRHFDQALDIARELNDQALEARALYLTAGTLFKFGCYEDALESGKRSLQLNLRVRDAWNGCMCQYVIGWIETMLGHPEAAVEATKLAIQTSLEFRQPKITQMAVTLWAITTEGNLPLQELLGRFERMPDDLSLTTFLRIAESHWHRFHGRTEESLVAAEHALESMNQLQPFSWSIRPSSAAPGTAYTHYAQALREHASAIQSSDPIEGRWLKIRALRAARRAVKFESVAKFNLPHALRELALSHAAFGRLKRAYHYASRSCEMAQQRRSKYQYAKSLLECGRIGEALGRPNARQQREQAELLIADMENRIRNIDHDIDVQPTSQSP